nr:hypothetical protein [Streptomyces sp. KY70]
MRRPPSVRPGACASVRPPGAGAPPAAPAPALRCGAGGWAAPPSRATHSSARPISQSRLGTTRPAGVKAIFRSSVCVPESLRHRPLTMSTASVGVAANSSPA